MRYRRIALTTFAIGLSLTIPGQLWPQATARDTAEQISAHASELYAWGNPPDTSRVLELLKSALRLYRGSRDRAGEAMVLARLGRVYDDGNQTDSALAFYGQAVRIGRETGNATQEGRLLRAIGAVYTRLGLPDSAQAHFDRALSIARERGDTDSEKLTLAEIRYAKVLDLLNRSPLLEPGMSVVKSGLFVQQAKAVLGNSPDVATLDSPEALTKALEQEFARKVTIIHATVQSEPTRIAVSYRRLSDPEGTALTVTTDDRIPLQAALYAFSAKDPTSGDPAQVQNVKCMTNCTVRFTFTPTR